MNTIIVLMEHDLIKFEEQQRCAYSAAEILFMSCKGDCGKARQHFEAWCKSDEAKDPKLEHFIDAFRMAQDAIERREGQQHSKATTVCDLLDAIDKSESDSK